MPAVVMRLKKKLLLGCLKMGEKNEVLYWQEMRRETVNKIIKQVPLGDQPAFYDAIRDRYFSSNPYGRFLSVATLIRFMESNALVNRLRGLGNAESKLRTADWRNNKDGYEQLQAAIRDVKLCRGIIHENA